MLPSLYFNRLLVEKYLVINFWNTIFVGWLYLKEFHLRWLISKLNDSQWLVVVCCWITMNIIGGRNTWWSYVRENEKVLHWERDIQKLVIKNIQRQVRELTNQLIVTKLQRQVEELSRQLTKMKKRKLESWGEWLRIYS